MPIYIKRRFSGSASSRGYSAIAWKGMSDALMYFSSLPGLRPLRDDNGNINLGNAAEFAHTPSGLVVRHVGEDIVRFLDVIMKRIKPKGPEVPSYSVIRNGLSSLVGSLIFCYADFTLLLHERRRIDATIQSALSSGRLTKDLKREQQWAGVVIVWKIITAIIQDALNSGVPNWDIPIQRALSILLVAALASRSGDITRRLDYNDPRMGFLSYGDITMKIVGEIDVTNIQAQIVIRNEKCHQ
ncbi:hypothetical protein VE03_04422 [Pseudogymnoascus sp. 23342-1-I1]|nr:hypothetical protein VE03_04422 [Pseudogymnoascus sp. 23342-1-I1]